MSYNGTAVGSPTYESGSAGFGSAIVLNGLTQYVGFSGVGPFGLITTGASWTVSARFKTLIASGQYVIASSYLAGTGPVFYISVQDGVANCYIDGIGTMTGGTSLANGAYHEVKLQCLDGKRATLWVDGALSVTSNGTFSGRVADTAWIGGYVSPTLYWPGSLQDVAVYANGNTPPYRTYTPAAAQLPTTALYRALYSLDGNVNDSATAYTTVAYSNSALTFSPYNWSLSSNSTGYFSQSPGAYMRTLFTGTKLFLLFDTIANTDNATDPPLVSVRIDGGAWTDYRALGITDATPVALANTRHYLEVALRAYDDIERWGTPTTDPRSAIVIKGIAISSSGVMLKPPVRPYNILIYGDSITDGTRVLGNTDSDTADNDPKRSWGWSFAQNVFAETGIVAYGGQAIDGTAHTVTVPPLKDSWNYQKDSTARDFTTAQPDLILTLMGQNDDGGVTATVQASFTTVLRGLLAACPHARIVCMGPLAQTQAAAISGAVAAIGSGRITYVNTTGWIPGFTSLDSVDGVHPYAADLVGIIAAKVAPYAYSALTAATGSGGGTNRGVLSRKGLG